MIDGSGKLAVIARSIVARFDSDIWSVEGSHLTTPKTERRIHIKEYAGLRNILVVDVENNKVLTKSDHVHTSTLATANVTLNGRPLRKDDGSLSY
jgi:hypothetical protein